MSDALNEASNSGMEYLNNTSGLQIFSLNDGQLVAFSQQQIDSFVPSNVEFLPETQMGMNDAAMVDQNSILNEQRYNQVPSAENTVQHHPLLNQAINTEQMSLEQKVDLIYQELRELKGEVQNFMASQPGVLLKVLTEMEILKKGMNAIFAQLSQKAKDDPEQAGDLSICVDKHSFDTPQKLRHFESFVEDIDCRHKMFQFIRKKYSKKEYNEPKSLFTAVSRYLVPAKVLLSYTWKTSTTTKKAFSTEFPKVVKFMTDFIQAEYKAVLEGEAHSFFADRVRYAKNDYNREMTRIADGKQERKTSKRTYTPRTKKRKCKSNSEDEHDVDKSDEHAEEPEIDDPIGPLTDYASENEAEQKGGKMDEDGHVVGGGDNRDSVGHVGESDDNEEVSCNTVNGYAEKGVDDHVPKSFIDEAGNEKNANDHADTEKAGNAGVESKK